MASTPGFARNGGGGMSDIAVAALLAGTVLVASTISVEIGLSVALIELLAGVIVGNAFHLDVPGWLSFLGSFAGVLLTRSRREPRATSCGFLANGRCRARAGSGPSSRRSPSW